MTSSSRHPLVLVMESNCKKKISVYANMDVFTKADFLKKKNKKKNKKKKKKNRVTLCFLFQ